MRVLSMLLPFGLALVVGACTAKDVDKDDTDVDVMDTDVGGSDTDVEDTDVGDTDETDDTDVTPVQLCGNGSLDEHELCDNGGATADCDASCVPTDCVVGVQFADLQAALDDDRCPVLWLPDATYTGPFTVARDVELAGAGADTVVTVSTPARLLEVSADALTLRRMTLTGGEADLGAVLSTSTTSLLIEDAFVRDNSATSAGGALRTEGPTVLRRVAFTGNHVVGEGVSGGAVHARGDLTVEDCTFVGNSASSTNGNAQGGALLQAGADNTLTITGSRFEDNTAHVTVDSGTGNRSAEGGAIYIYLSSSELDDVTLEGNTADCITPDAVSAARVSGGALYIAGGTHALTNVMLTDSEATGVGEGAYVSGGAVALSYANTTMTGVTIRGSRVVSDNSGNAGGVLVASTPTRLIGTDVLFEDNTVTSAANPWGGALFGAELSSGAVVRFDRSAFVNNRATGTGTYGVYGGGVRVGAGDWAFTNVTFSGNAGGGNDLSVVGATLQNSAGNVQLSNVTFGPSSAIAPAALYADVAVGSTATITARNTHFGASVLVTQGINAVFASDGYNIVADATTPFTEAGAGDQLSFSATLPALADNGGPTPTHALDVASLAIDAGNAAGCVDDLGAAITVDQRGQPRSDGHCDVGAFEAQ